MSNSLNNEIISIELADVAQIIKKGAVKENKITEIEPKLFKRIQVIKILLLQNIEEGHQKN